MLATAASTVTRRPSSEIRMPAQRMAKAILFLCQLGQEGGHAVADILSGAVSPSGKLTDTWARRYSAALAGLAADHIDAGICPSVDHIRLGDGVTTGGPEIVERASTALLYMKNLSADVPRQRARKGGTNEAADQSRLFR